MGQFFAFFSEQIRFELLKCQCQKVLKSPSTTKTTTEKVKLEQNIWKVDKRDQEVGREIETADFRR